jgi:arylsulfatase A-like enzyme
MKKQQNPFKGPWISRVLALLLPFLLLSLVAWTADRQGPRGKADVLDCDPMVTCFLDLIMTLQPIKNSIDHPVGPNQPVEWNQGPETAELPPNERPPNIIVILADDMGFNDISFYNGGAADGSLQTPNIDSLAQQGVVFTNGYAANATCAPSRAALVTGRYSTRFGYEFTPLFKVGYTIFDLMSRCSTDPYPLILDLELADTLPDLEELGMPPSEITIAEKLKEAGYHTAHIGKWHLGGSNGSRPEDQGFDESLYLSGTLYLPEDSPEVVNAKLDFSPIDKMMWASSFYSAQFNGGPEFEPGGYLTDYYTDEAVKVIEANRNRPFFLYLSHWGIHDPLQATREDYDALSQIQDYRLRVYAAMIRALDRSVGRVVDALDENGLTENTLVIFTSDNGGAPYVGLPDINKPYRGWKTTFFEGGIHVPYFIKWPLVVTAGTSYDKPVSHFDIFATAAAAAGVSLPGDRTLDGVDLVPYITGAQTGDPHETLFWRSGPYQVVLSEDDATGDWWKMSVIDIPDKVWLYNLTTDPTEQTNVADSMPAKVVELQALLDAHNAEQVEPIWPFVLQDYVTIDKTDEEVLLPEDEYIYWAN